MYITDKQGSRACLMNNGKNSLCSGLAWASDGNDIIVPEKGHLSDAGRGCCHSGLTSASIILPSSSSSMLASWRDARWSSCSNGLAGASGGEASWPAKLLLWLAGLMSTGDCWWSHLSQGTPSVIIPAGLVSSLYSLGADPTENTVFIIIAQQYVDYCLLICCRGNLFIESLPGNEHLLWLHYSGFQTSCQYIVQVEYGLSVSPHVSVVDNLFSILQT
jgi:hypothetical protein